MNELSEFMLFSVAVIIGVVIYLAPTIIANNRRHPSTTGIIILNLFTGWTLLGWIVCFVWAYSNDTRPVVKKTTVNKPSLASELKELSELVKQEIITEEEFNERKKKLLKS